jgi:hypothetical protein
MPKTIEITDVPPDRVEAIRELLRSDGASEIESIEQHDGSFTLKAVMQGSEEAHHEISREGDTADEADSGLPGDPDFPTDRE